MSWRPRIRTYVKWSLLGLTVALLALWVGTARSYVGHTCSRVRVGWGTGQFGFGLFTDLVPPASKRPSFWEFSWTVVEPFRWGFKYVPPRPMVPRLIVQIPGWILACPPAIATYMMFRSDRIRRRRLREGRCLRCSFELTGTPAGAPCPECGGQR